MALEQIPDDQKLDTAYRERFLERKSKFINFIDCVQSVAENLFTERVFTEAEMKAVVSKQFSCQQKELMFNLLSEKKFAQMDAIIRAMDVKSSFVSQGQDIEQQNLGDRKINETVIALLKSLKILITKHHHRHLNHLASIPEHGLNEERPNGDRQNDDVQALNAHDDDLDSSNHILLHSNGIGSQFPSTSITLIVGGVTVGSGIRSVIENASFAEIKEEIMLVQSLDELIDLDEETGKTSLHACVQRTSEVVECVKLLLERYKVVEKAQGARGSHTLHEFVDLQDKKLRTAAHIAAERSLVSTTKELFFTYQCGVFHRDTKGRSTLDVLYANVPETVDAIFEAAISINNNDPSESRFEVDIDFRSLIDDEEGVESKLLAKLIHQDRRIKKKLLGHFLVQLLVELKWNKMWKYLFMSIAYDFLLLIWYTGFVIDVFLVNCRRTNTEAVNATLEVAMETEDPVSLFNYLFGQSGSLLQIFALGGDEYRQNCPEMDWTDLNSGASGLFINIGVQTFIREYIELIRLRDIMPKNLKKLSAKIWFCVKAYLKSQENLFQLSFAVLVILVTSLRVNNQIYDFHYSAAAVSLIVGWGLLMIGAGNLFSMGIYVQLLYKVTRSFAWIMSIYVVMMIAFSIAFSIMFPDEEAFKTLPTAMSRIMTMMTGEFEYSDLFYGDEGGPPIALTAHFIYLCFAILLSILLMNLLIGLVVSDVEILREKSQIVLLSVKIEEIYLMELVLRSGNRYAFRKISGLFCKHRDYEEDFADIYVTRPPQPGETTKKEIRKHIDQLPKRFQKPLRDLVYKGGTNQVSLRDFVFDEDN